MDYLVFSDKAIGGMFLTVLLIYLGIRYKIKTHKIKIKEEKKKQINYAPVIITAIFGYFTVINASSIIESVIGGIFVYGAVYFFSIAILDWTMKYFMPVETFGIPLKKIVKNKDMLDLLESEGIETVNELIEEDIGSLSSGTGLSAETIIELRTKARSFLKKPKKK